MTTGLSDPGDKPKLVQHEWRDQRGYAVLLGKMLPVEAYWTAIDVGRSKSAQEGQLRKARGVKSGIPDFLIVWRGRTLWCECKHGESLSPNQRVTRDALLANGHAWALVRSPEDLEHACRSAGIPLRATLGEVRDRIEDQRARLPAKRKRGVRRVQAGERMTVAQYRRMHAKGLL